MCTTSRLPARGPSLASSRSRGWWGRWLVHPERSRRACPAPTPGTAGRRSTVLPVVFLPVLLAAAQSTASAQPPEGDAPHVTYLGPVAADVLCLKVREGRVEYAQQVPYEAQPGDRIEEPDTGRWVVRDGRDAGCLVGRDGKLMFTFDRVVGGRLDPQRLERPTTFALSCADDPHYAQPQAPQAVYRKTKPTDMAQTGRWAFDFPLEHTVYLRLPAPLVEGCQYRLAFTEDLLPPQEFTYEPARLRSDAVHVSHLGFRPDDPAKSAFLSCWMGTGGALSYPADLRFEVLDDETNASVLAGQLTLAKAANDKTEDAYNSNYNGTDVYEADFSALQREGGYRVYVVGVGCSYPFRIAADVWREPFMVATRAFLYQRSGIELGPPFIAYHRPRCFHPDDGVKVFASTCGLIDSGNGLGTEATNFGNLVAGLTDEIVPNAWGGYMDAGDWDRRIQHLTATRQLLELMELFPSYFRDLPLNLPESGNGLPDIANECLWNLDCYRRMQTPEGGIRGGIESSEHPRRGEASWNESLTVMAYAPDPWSSYVYAGVAARAAGVLQGLNAELAATYRDSALAAMRWAEAKLPERAGKNDPHPVQDSRNLAAVELYRLTGDEEWHRLFLQTTVFTNPQAPLYEWQHHEQRDAAWVYLRTEQPGADQAVRQNCLNATRREADERVQEGRQTAFHWTKNAWAPTSWGALTTPDAITLVRAHALTGDERYLRAAVLACMSGAGANPLNLCYTTGLGYESPQHPLHVDTRVMGIKPPPGLTVYGPMNDPRSEYWATKLLDTVTVPKPADWPTVEAYWDIWLDPALTEYTVMQTLTTTAYTWGYLAARSVSP